jgi:aminoglycoside phosphotransferase (APT) family kinase protein
MSEPWKSDHVVSPSQAKQLIERQFPQLSPVSLVEYGKGFDNTVYLVNQQYIFRFPRREIAVDLMKVERALLPHLVKILPISIPEPLFFGEATDSYPWAFTGYKLVKGNLIEHLSIDQRLKSVEPLAQFLECLHHYPIEQAQQLGVPNDELQRLDIQKRKPFLIENTNRIIQSGFWKDPRLKEVVEQLPVVIPNHQQVLNHGDLHIRNIIMNEQGIFSGVIDWGDLHIGHPAVDLSILYSFLPPEGRKHFLHIYGEIDDQTKILAFFRAIYIHTLLLLYGHNHVDPKLVHAAEESLHLCLLEPPF